MDGQSDVAAPSEQRCAGAGPGFMGHDTSEERGGGVGRSAGSKLREGSLDRQCQEIQDPVARLEAPRAALAPKRRAEDPGLMIDEAHDHGLIGEDPGPARGPRQRALALPAPARHEEDAAASILTGHGVHHRAAAALQGPLKRQLNGRLDGTKAAIDRGDGVGPGGVESEGEIGAAVFEDRLEAELRGQVEVAGRSVGLRQAQDDLRVEGPVLEERRPGLSKRGHGKGGLGVGGHKLKPQAPEIQEGGSIGSAHPGARLRSAARRGPAGRARG